MFLNGARIAGVDSSGRSLLADRLSTESTLSARQSVAAGEVRLMGAEIAGNLNMDGATISGTLAISDASIGNVVLDGATITTGGATVALLAPRVRVSGDVYLRRGFHADGTVRLSARGSTDASISRTPGRSHRLELRDTTCAAFRDTKSAWPPDGQLVLDGFQYGRLDDRAPWRDRLAWVRRQGLDSWSADPYERLADFYGRTGDEAGARRLRIAKHDDELAHLRHTNPAGTRYYRFWRRPFGWLLGYGYRRAVAGWLLVATIVVAAVAFARLDSAGAMVPTVPADVAAQPCGEAYPCFHAFVYGADLVLPIIDFGQQGAWRPDSTAPWGTLAEYLHWGLIGLGWVLASVFVAAFTSLVRKD